MAEAANDKKRLRITRACDYCRRKKVKCYSSPGQTCTNCASYGMTCEFNDGTKKRGPPKGYIDALEKRIRQIETALTSIQTTKTTNTNTGANSTATGSVHRLNHHKIDSTLPVHKKAKSAKSDSVLYLGDLSSFQFFSNKIKLDGSQTFWRGQRLEKFGKQVVLIDDENAYSTQNLTNEMPPETFHVPKIQTMFPRKDIHHWIYSVTGVDNFTADRLLKIYFANVHPLLPVVNKTAFLKQYRDRCDSYPTPDLLNAMFGAAARFVECESRYRNQNQFQPPDMVWDVPKGWSDRFFEQSQAFITESSTLATLSKVQSIILIHNHSGNLDAKSSACWLLGGLAVRLAQGLGLYRDCAEWDIPESEKETRRRVWWALYVTDRFHSASLGRPISIRDEDIDVRYPDSSATWKEIMDEPDDDDGDDDGPRFPSATHKPENASETVEIYQLFIQLIKLSEILGRILQGLYTPKAQRLSHEHGSDAIVTRLDHELTEWRFGFPTALQKTNFDDFDENTGYLAPVIATTLICYYGLLVLLHRPFIERTGSGKSKARATYSSFRIGSSAASRGINIASQMEPRDFLMFPYSFSLYPVLQCCLIHMYNTKNPDPKLASSAKIDLATGLALINKLKQMSHNAEKLHSLLEVLMENNNINLNNAMNTTDEQQQQQQSKSSSSSSSMNDIFVADSNNNSGNKNSNNNDSNNNVSSNKSDIGDGLSKENTLTQNKNEQERIPSYPQNINTPSIPNSSFSASLLFNPSLEMASLTDIPVVSSSPSPNSVTEAFSLRQFGFNISDKQNQMDFALQDVNGLSRMNQMFPQDQVSSSSSSTTLKQNITTTNPSTVDNQSSSTANLSLFDHQQYQQQQQSKASASSPSSSSSPTNFPSLYNNNNNTSHSPLSATSTPASTSFLQLMSPIPVTALEGSNQDPNTVFRNNPNNPFFGIPSSMDWSEWSEWNQRNQGISFI